MPTHYEALGLAVGATDVEIRHAYRTSAKTAHPDAGGDAATFRAVLAAYQTLIDPDRRRRYDDSLGLLDATIAGRANIPADGEFSGTVSFPSWMRGFTDDQWNPDDGAERPITAHAPTGDGPPADVVWWWPEHASAPPLPAGPLLIASRPGGVTALATNDGIEAWRTDLGSTPTGSPLSCGASALIMTEDGGLHALEVGRGVIEWQARVPRPGPGGLVGRGDLALVSPAEPLLVGLDARDGRRRWQANLAAAASAAPAIGDDTVVVVSGRRTIEGIDPRRGRHRWRITLRHPVDLPPCIVGGGVWLAGGAGAGTLVRLELATGAVGATFRAGSAVAGLIPDGELLYATVAGPSRLLAVDALGNVHLDVATARVCPEPTFTAAIAYLADPAGVLLTVDRRVGRVTSSVTLPFEPIGAPVVAGDRLVFTARDGRIWATEVPAPRGA